MCIRDSFSSVYFACGATKYATTTVNGVVVTAAEQQAVVETSPGTNNVIGGTAADAVTSGYLRGTGPAAATAINPANFNPQPASGLAAFFVSTNYLGAISPTAGDANATWFQGWTCNSNRATFTGSNSCTAVPN